MNRNMKQINKYKTKHDFHLTPFIQSKNLFQMNLEKDIELSGSPLAGLLTLGMVSIRADISLHHDLL